MTLRTLNYGNYGIFLIMGIAGFCPSTVAPVKEAEEVGRRWDRRELQSPDLPVVGLLSRFGSYGLNIGALIISKGVYKGAVVGFYGIGALII